MEKSEMEKIAEDLMKVVNCMNNSSKDFVNVVCNDHRTLQQSAFRLFSNCIREWARQSENMSRYSDLRNEQTLKLSAKILKVLDEDDSHIPLI